MDASESMRQWRSSAPRATQAKGVEGWIAAALKHSPALRAQHALWSAQVATARGADRWRDPVLTYGWSPLPIETRLGPNPHTLGLTQSAPWFGHVDARVAAQAARAQRARHTFDATYLMVRAEVQSLYWSIWALEQEQRLVTQQQALIDTTAGALKARVESGGRPASALSGLSIKRARLSARLHVLGVELVKAKARLGEIVGAPTASFEQIAQAAAPAVTAQRAPLSDAMARVPPPHIQALEQAVRVRRKQRRLAEFERLPTFQLGVQWSVVTESQAQPRPADAGRDALMVRVGVSVPLWRGATEATLDASEAMILHAQAQRDAAVDKWKADLRSVDEQMHHMREHVALIEGTLLPQARAHESLVRADYEAARVPLEDVLTATQALYTQRIDLARRRAMFAALRARWELLTGHGAAAGPSPGATP